MNIRFATCNDLNTIGNFDQHIDVKELKSIIEHKRVLIAEEEETFEGWLRYNLFWDNTPFMNMLYILEPHRGKGIGKLLVARWEDEMKSAQYKLIMTSTLSNESAQHFYRKLNYKDAGSLILPNEPLEILFIKEL